MCNLHEFVFLFPSNQSFYHAGMFTWLLYYRLGLVYQDGGRDTMKRNSQLSLLRKWNKYAEML